MEWAESIEKHDVLSAFLRAENLEEHTAALVQLGYDDVRDLVKLNMDELASLCRRMTEANIPPRHQDKVVAAIGREAGRAAAAASVEKPADEANARTATVPNHQLR